MAELCFSSMDCRFGTKGGKETVTIDVDGMEWAGSEVTSWAISEGVQTPSHIDTLVVN